MLGPKIGHRTLDGVPKVPPPPGLRPLAFLQTLQHCLIGDRDRPLLRQEGNRGLVMPTWSLVYSPNQCPSWLSLGLVVSTAT